MKITKVAAITGGLALGAIAGAAFQFNSASAAVPAGGPVSVAKSSPVASPTASPSASPSCPPMKLAIAFTNNVTDVVALHLHLPWGRAGEPEGRMIEDYGAYDGVSVREQLPVHDVTTDDQGDAIAFLYGHVREFEVESGRHVEAGALIAKSGGDPDDPGAGFSDMANVHFEVIESAHPLLAHAGTVNPHQFLENLYAYAAACS